MATYEGWKNYETWNVSLWINNTEPLYRAAVAFMEENPDPKNPYMAFILNTKIIGIMTPDKVPYVSEKLDYEELNEMMRELVGN